MPTSPKNDAERHRFATEASDFGDWFPRSCDGESLAFGSAVDHVAAMVA